PAYEAPTADLAARFEPPVHSENVAPRREQRLARDQPPEYHAVASQQLPRDGLGDRVLRQRRRGSNARPASGSLDAERCDLAPPPESSDRTPAVGGHQQRAQPGEAVGGDESPGDQLAEPLLHLRAQQAGRVHQVAKERRAAFAERIAQRAGGM